MKNSLVIANLLHRRGRTVAAVLGISVAVSLVILMVGLAHGQISSRGKREAAVGAEIAGGPRGYFRLEPSTAPLMMPVEAADQLVEVEGVAAITPVGQYVESGPGGIGFHLIEGVDWESYRRITPLDFIAGGPPRGAQDAMVDAVLARSRRLRVGDRIDALGHAFHISGIYQRESGARIKIPLRRMQELAGQADRCSFFLVKCKDVNEQEQVALRLQTTFPEHQFLLVRDLPSFYVRHMPAALTTFLNVVIVLAVIICIIVVMLTMYTAVHERTREIGILKSLGASRGFIIQIFEEEAAVMSLFGVVVAFGGSFAAARMLHATTELNIQFESNWFLIAAGIALLSSLAGGLYPALRAAAQDPVEALSYE
ncbi:MAG: ABC transporter permease [Acidobacteria bacterium]|nr:ABC transporter permease [Acidobacteriota bacterium]